MKRPPLPSIRRQNPECETSGWNVGGNRIPDVRHPGGMSTEQNYGCVVRMECRWNTILDVRHPDHWLKCTSLATSFQQLATAHVPPPSDGVSERPVRMIAYPIRTAFHCFAMDSKELSSILDCFGDQITNKKIPKLTQFD